VGPPGKLDLAELGRRGGKARGRKQPERASDRYERMALKALEELLTGEGNATAKSALCSTGIASNSTLSVEPS
jgi:hypothetical protein